MARINETAFAKINLDLRVCRRRGDGYHDLDSLVVFAATGDRLAFQAADSLTLAIEGPFKAELSSGEDNLVMRAAKALMTMTGHDAGACITLQKCLPVASGLGGGSADAAATLRGLTRLWNLPLSLADLVPLARTLGADVPVCLGSTAVRMQSIGDRLTLMSLPARLPMILINPGVAVSTPDVFRALSNHSGTRDQASFGETERGFRNHLANSINDLEAPAIRIAPLIAAVLEALRSQNGCALARMSGSGATCFGLFDDMTKRDRAVSALTVSHPGWWVAGTDVQ